MRKMIVVVAAGLLNFFVLASIGGAELISNEAITEARKFTQIIDNGEAVTAYAQASVLLQLAQDQQDWVDTITRSHKLLGTVQERTLVAVRSVQTFPQLPDGEYLLVQFSARTLVKKDAREVILMQQQGDVWLVADYSIR